MKRRERIPGLIQRDWNIAGLSAIPRASRGTPRSVDPKATPFAISNGLVAQWDLWSPGIVSGGKLVNSCFQPADNSNSSAYDLNFGTTSGANTTFINSLHQSTAEFTIEFLVESTPYPPGGIYPGLFSTYQQNPTGIEILIRSDTRPYGIAFKCFNSGSISLSVNTPLPSGNESGQIHVLLSVSQASGQGVWCINNVITTFSATYVSPTTTSSLPFVLGYTGPPGYGSLQNGTKIFFTRIYNRALSQSEAQYSYANAQRRFPKLI